MKFLLNRAAICLFVISFMLAGCSSTSISVKEDKELDALVEALVKNSDDMKKKAAERIEKGFKLLKVDKEADTISADLDNVSVAEAVRRIFAESGKPYMLDNVKLYGRITVCFDKLPFSDALNIILQPILLAAETGADGIVRIKSSTEPNTKDPAAKINAEITLRNMDTETAISLLTSLFGGGAGGGMGGGMGGMGGGMGGMGGGMGASPMGGGASDPSAGAAGASPMGGGMGGGAGGDSGGDLKFTAIAGSNTIYLNGKPADVANATQLLLKADRETQHVMIEVLVIEFSSGALEQIGSKIKDLQDGKFEKVNLDFSGTGGSAISFSQLASDVPNKLTSFSAAINILMSNNKARLISRPFISTISGKVASMQIASDRYVIVSTANGASSTQAIQAGVKLKITPTVLGDSQLRMAVEVEDSQFSGINPPNVSTEVNKNAANTVMQVGDGQTIVVGGLVMNRRSWGNTGFPWLRNIPIVNWLFASQQDDLSEKEVAIYVTPHIWKPEMISPMIAPDALTIKEEKGATNFIKNLK